MTEVLHSPSNLPSLPSSSFPCTANDSPRQSRALLSPGAPTAVEGEGGGKRAGSSGKTKVAQGRRRRDCGRKTETDQEEQFSFLALLVAAVRKSLIGCTTENEEGIREAMEIGRPTNVRHVAHVTFDRFHGFLGLPVEFEPDVPRRAPSASASVFGVSTESMQCSYDSRGNSIPTILMLMQRHLYEQGGLQAEGIFRINAENSEEEQVRERLNSGVVPDDIDVHCLAGLIKAWFRELPSGVLDPLTPEQVMQCQTEDECAQLVKLLPPTEASLLDWAINLMADVVQEEEHNKMNARNLATVFAPNMTQMADPLSALMYAVKVMNFLQTLILVALRERREPPGETGYLRPRRDSDTHGDDETEHAETPRRLSEENSTGDDRRPSSNGGKVTLEGSTGEALPSANDPDAAAVPDARVISSSDVPGATGKRRRHPKTGSKGSS